MRWGLPASWPGRAEWSCRCLGLTAFAWSSPQVVAMHYWIQHPWAHHLKHLPCRSTGIGLWGDWIPERQYRLKEAGGGWPWGCPAHLVFSLKEGGGAGLHKIPHPHPYPLLSSLSISWLPGHFESPSIQGKREHSSRALFEIPRLQQLPENLEAIQS